MEKQEEAEIFDRGFFHGKVEGENEILKQILEQLLKIKLTTKSAYPLGSL